PINPFLNTIDLILPSTSKSKKNSWVIYLTSTQPNLEKILSIIENSFKIENYSLNSDTPRTTLLILSLQTQILPSKNLIYLIYKSQKQKIDQTVSFKLSINHQEIQAL
ncbi:16009_t:CDS:1, partial [Gigaspora margarita]